MLSEESILSVLIYEQGLNDLVNAGVSYIRCEYWNITLQKESLLPSRSLYVKVPRPFSHLS